MLGVLVALLVHVSAAVIAAVALVAHLRVHGAFSWSPVVRRADLSRRTALRAVGLGAGAGWSTRQCREPSRWRLQVAGRQMALDELRAGGDVARATLDCANGWYSEQEWRWVRLDRLLGEVWGRSIDVVSATGYSRQLPLRKTPHLLLAPMPQGDLSRPATVHRCGWWPPVAMASGG